METTGILSLDLSYDHLANLYHSSISNVGFLLRNSIVQVSKRLAEEFSCQHFADFNCRGARTVNHVGFDKRACLAIMPFSIYSRYIPGLLK